MTAQWVSPAFTELSTTRATFATVATADGAKLAVAHAIRGSTVG